MELMQTTITSRSSVTVGQFGLQPLSFCWNFILLIANAEGVPCFPAFSMCVPLPPWQFHHPGWVAGLQLESTCRIPYSMGYESQQQRNWGIAAILVKLKGAGEGMSLFWISSTSWLHPMVASGPARALQVKAVLTNPGMWGVSGSLEMCKALVLGCDAGQGWGSEDPAWHKLGGGGRTVILFCRMWCHFRHRSRILLKPALSLGKWHCRWWVSFQCNVILLLI